MRLPDGLVQAVTAAVFLCFCGQPMRAQAAAAQDGLTLDEIAVMAAVVQAAYDHATPGWVLIGARTATFECNPPADIGIDVGGCSGMRVASETPKSRLATVRAEISELTDDLVADVFRKNTHSTILERPLPIKVPQILWAPGLAFTPEQPEGNPTFAAYLSRPGLDHAGTRALIYLGTMNWTDRSKSMGQYVYLEKVGSAWVVKAHAQVWG